MISYHPLYQCGIISAPWRHINASVIAAGVDITGNKKKVPTCAPSDLLREMRATALAIYALS